MMRKKFLQFFVAIFLALAPCCDALVFANAADDKRAELEAVQLQMEKMRQRRDVARERAENANAGLRRVMNNLRELEAESASLQKQSVTLQKNIAENQAKLDAKRAEVEGRTKIYRKRLRDIYINGQINYLDVLLGAKDFGDFSTRMYLLQKIIGSDLELLEQLKKDAEEIQKYQQSLETQMQELRETQAAIENSKARSERLREQRSQVLYKAQEEELQSQSELERLVALSENIAVMLRNLEENGVKPTQGGTGKFMWPCRGEITSYYGWRTHPIFGTTKYHSGMDIAVDYGTPIHAADSGKVVYSGWLGGYGYCVMIDHGGGLVSLYGHNQSLSVVEGQYVAKGTVIAAAGSTGYSTGPHCHFEVRLHGEVTEPLNYLP